MFRKTRREMFLSSEDVLKLLNVDDNDEELLFRRKLVGENARLVEITELIISHVFLRFNLFFKINISNTFLLINFLLVLVY